MANILDIFSKPTILNYVKAREYPPMVGETLFPEAKKPDFEFEYIIGGQNLPVMAHVHSFDTESEIGTRDGYSKVNMEAFLVKRKIRIDEKTIIKLSNPRNEAEFEYVKNTVFADVDNVVNGVRSRIEKMRMDVISSGTLVINENGLNLNVDYLVPTANKPVLTGSQLWSDPDSDPLEDIRTWKELIKDTTGEIITKALTSSKVLLTLSRHAKVRKAIFGVNNEMMPTREQLNTFLESYELPKIATYDAKYRVRNDDGSYTTTRYFPENKFVMMPDGPMGETLYGPTAEEIELISDRNVDLRSVGNIVVEIYKTSDPVAHWTKAVALAAPSFPLADSVIQATVTQTV